MPYALFFLLYQRTPKIGDELHISDEMKRVNYAVVTSMVVYFILAVASGIFHLHENIFAILMCLSSSTWLFLACMFHTRYVLKHVNQWMYSTLDSLSSSQHSRLKLDILPSRLTSFMSEASIVFSKDGQNGEIGNGNEISVASQTQTNTKKNGRVSVTLTSKANNNKDNNPLRKRDVFEVLDNEATFNSFIQHLNGEFSLGMIYLIYFCGVNGDCGSFVALFLCCFKRIEQSVFYRSLK